MQVTSKQGCVTIQGDEGWFLVGHKGIKQWIWLALGISSREIVGVYVGEHSEEGPVGCGTPCQGYIGNVPCLHRFLRCLWIGLSCFLATRRLARKQGKPVTLSALALRSKTIQLYAAATRFPISAKDIVLFQEAGQS